jgi:M6 family metalloprotease-like protein
MSRLPFCLWNRTCDLRTLKDKAIVHGIMPLKSARHTAIGILICAAAHSASFCGQGDSPCGLRSVQSPARALDDIGGRHLPARGTLRVLVAFVSFPDDETPHPFWPAHRPPDSMRQFIDPDTLTKSSASFNLTNYFSQMSLGKFHLIGDVIWVESKHQQTEYRNWPYGRANKDVIREVLDSLVDFAPYDQWTRVGDYDIREEPDGVVDMIIMVWRTTMYEYLGEASLGYLPAIPVDGGSRYVWMGYPERYDVPQGSGVTCEYPYTDSPRQLMKTMVHEFGHWLLGGMHPYSTQLAGKHQYWGIICAPQRISSCMNSYEREALGWITIPAMDPDLDIALRDYVTTGDALKFHPPNGTEAEYFYIENHQQLSAFDDVTLNPADKGIWLLHQQYQYINFDNLAIRPSDGDWDWATAANMSSCYGASLPVFRRGNPDVLAGVSHRDQIPTSTSLTNWLYVLAADSGSARCASYLGGENLQGAFDTAACNLFSPYSNPSSSTWDRQPTTFAFEVRAQTGQTMTVHRYADPLDAPPARRFLGSDPTAVMTAGDGVPLAWGTQWSTGQPLEADATSFTLERSVDGGVWNRVYDGPATGWKDPGVHYDSLGTHIAAFRVKVHDNGGKSSTWSNVYRVRASSITSVRSEAPNVPANFGLCEPFPNPCNPTAEIGFQTTTAAKVLLTVYDILGREISVLVNEYKEPGVYSVRFDGGGLAGGVYICRLQAGGRESTKKIVLVK